MVLMKELIRALFLAPLIVLIKFILRFHFLVTHLNHMMELHWTTLVLFLMDLNMV